MRQSRLGRRIPALMGLVTLGFGSEPLFAQPATDPPSTPPAAEPAPPGEPPAPGEPTEPGADQPPAAEPAQPADANEPPPTASPPTSPSAPPADTAPPISEAPPTAPSAPAKASKPKPRSDSLPKSVVAAPASPVDSKVPASAERSTEAPPTLWKPPPDAVRLGIVDSALAVPLESLGLLALVTYTGFSDWKWGTASFRFNSEGWFGMDTGSGGMDKVGHAYGSYMSSELLYWRLRVSQGDRPVVSLYPALFGLLLYTYIEFFDGYSVDHGFSYEDMIMDCVGVLNSTLRNTIPAIRKGFDFRLEYWPSENFGFHPVIDYEGQKFLGVFKLAAFPALQRSPARFVEFMLGYYTRGFDKDLDVEFKSAHLFFGVGFSLEQLFFRPLDKAYGWPFGFMGLAANYFQVPYTYASAESVRTAPTGK